MVTWTVTCQITVTCYVLFCLLLLVSSLFTAGLKCLKCWTQYIEDLKQFTAKLQSNMWSIFKLSISYIRSKYQMIMYNMYIYLQQLTVLLFDLNVQSLLYFVSSEKIKSLQYITYVVMKLCWVVPIQNQQIHIHIQVYTNKLAIQS